MLISSAAEAQWLCKVLTCLQHVAWLGAFSWMCFIALTTTSAVRSTIPTSKQTISRWKYFIISTWPVPIVTACVVSDHYNVASFTYWSSSTCWIDERYALILTFGVPIGIIIIINAVCFILVAYALHRHRRTTQMCGETLSDVNVCKILSKLMSLMGLTWIFGFLANIKQLSFMNYAFVVTNSLQGVFIFFSFVCTKKIALLLKGKIEQIWSTHSTRTSELSI